MARHESNRARFLLVPLVVLLSLAPSGCFTITRPPLPRRSGTLTVAGLDGRVEIHRDRTGVASVIAQSDHDAYFAQGYIHAQERFYQMEFWRRVGAGRLSELYGESVLASDVYLRTMGFRRLAQRQYEEAPPLLRDALDAYANGVNACIADRKPRKLAAEFTFLGIQGVELEIEPWTPLDSLTWPLVMSQDMGTDYQLELLRLDVIRAVGIEMAQDYFAPYRYDEMPTTITREDLAAAGTGAFSTASASGNDADLELLANAEFLQAIDHVDRAGTVLAGREQLIAFAFDGDATSGSNLWVVSGDHTESGMPWLANDPHLAMQLPSIWYELSIHVQGPNGWNCHGFSFAGMPGVIIGHNDHVVWGMSTANPDVQDLYVELINPENPNEYRVGDEWVEMETRQEVIRIAGADPYFLTVRSTRNGPVVTDSGGAVPYSSYDVAPVEMFPTDLRLTELSLRWTALDAVFPLYAVLLYDHATDVHSFRDALAYFHTPSHNYLIADTSGNIAYCHPGRLPVRGAGSGSLPNPGWDDAYQWRGFIAHDDLPFVVNPPRGYFSNENQAVMPEGLELFGEHLYSPGFRAFRAETLLRDALEDGVVTADEHRSMQTDIRTEFGARIVPHVTALADATIDRAAERLVRLLAESPAGDDEVRELEEQADARVRGALRARDILSNWDLLMDRESAAAALFAQFYLELIDHVYTDQIPVHVWEGPWKTSTSYRLQNSLWLLVDDPTNPWWDDTRTLDVVEQRDEILARALATAYAELEERLGERPERWEWGDLHTLTYTNGTLGKSGIGFVERIFNRGPVPISGGLNVLFRNDFKVPTAFETTHTASMRMIADTSDWSRTLWINSPGQSGHPASRQYDDAFDAYVEGEYFTHPWTVKEIRSESRKTMFLEPER